ncbi:relaxase/mobilization nuclease domain-containing protein [Asaia sp. BMEF1]|uniref:relaxase/mobilization nuclease domain-containing protein n=1 Tax=Asaia sp. BMEF1 TaxID=3155932 RepID=UPI003F66F298
MILKSNPIRTASGSGAIWHHLVGKTGDNERIQVWKGRRQDIEDCIADATAFNRVNAVQHFQISSREKLTTEQFADCITMLAQEFGFKASDVALAVIHTKIRHDSEADNRHCHILVRTTNAETGKVLDVSHRYERQEKVARLFELKHGLELTKGRHNLAVYHAVPEEYRERLQVLCEGTLPNSVLSDPQSRRSQRQGARPFDIKYRVRDLYAGSTDWQAFQSAISSQGWSLMAGEKKPNVVLLKDEHGVIVGSLSRLLGVRKAEFSAFILGHETPEQSAIRQGHKEDVASPGPRDTSRDPSGKGETPVDPSDDEHGTPSPDPYKPSEDSVSTAPEPASGRKISQPVLRTGATAGSVAGTGAVPNSSSKTRASITRGMTQSEAQAVIDFNEAQTEKEQQLRDHLHGQKHFADLLTELAESFRSRWSHLPTEPHPDPKSRDTAYIRAGHEKRLAGLRQDWLDAESRVTLWTPWHRAEARKARAVFDEALEALGYHRHDIGKLDMSDDSNYFYAMKWMADWIVRSREHRHRDWINLPEVKTYLISKAEMARLMDHLKRTEDVALLLIAKTRPEEAMRRLAHTLHMPDAGLENPPQTRLILKNRNRQNRPSSLTL